MKILLVGQSGSGKSTIADTLYKHGLSKIIECTTRPMRANERDGFDYEFISRKIYDDMVLNDELILCSKFDTKFGEWCYGVKRSYLNNIKNFVLVTNYMALNNTNQDYLQDCIIVMLKASEELYRRANDRGDDLEEFSRRLNTDRDYISQIEEMCDLVIDTSKHSVNETVNIILAQ